MTLPIMAEHGHKQTSREANEVTAVYALLRPDLRWQTALSYEGEYCVHVNGHPYYVDGAGFNANGECEMVIEYNGCLWHGLVTFIVLYIRLYFTYRIFSCPQCYDANKLWIDGVRTYGQMYKRTMARHNAIAKKYNLEAVWAHEWRARKAADPSLQALCDSIKMEEHTCIVAREALYGLSHAHACFVTVTNYRSLQAAALNASEHMRTRARCQKAADTTAMWYPCTRTSKHMLAT